MKSRVRRLEEENQKKEKEIEQLLDPSKSEDMRRTLADKKPDAGVVSGSIETKSFKWFCHMCEFFPLGYSYFEAKNIKIGTTT